MLKRKIERQLTEWKNTSGHKPLIVKGADSAVRRFLYWISQKRTTSTLST